MASISVIPERMTIPVDENDCNFTQCFTVENAKSNEAKEFFDEFGFIIFKDVIDPKLCQETRQSMWDHLENQIPGFHRNDSTTWELWPGKGFGMSGKLPVFTKEILRIRQSEQVYQCFEAVMSFGNKPMSSVIPNKVEYHNDNDENDEDKINRIHSEIVCSHDRWILYRKTMGIGPQFEEKPNWRTRKNIHLDMNPWEFQSNDKNVYSRINQLTYSHHRDFIHENNDVAIGMGQCVQGMINLKHNYINDGGTIIVPGSHKFHKQFFHINKNITNCIGPMQYPNHHKHFLGKLENLSQKVCLREGSLVIWDQRLFHGSTPNLSTNNRLGIPIRFFRKCLMNQTRSEARSHAIWQMIQKIGFENELTKMGQLVFGLNHHPNLNKSPVNLSSSTSSTSTSKSHQVSTWNNMKREIIQAAEANEDLHVQTHNEVTSMVKGEKEDNSISKLQNSACRIQANIYSNMGSGGGGGGGGAYPRLGNGKQGSKKSVLKEVSEDTMRRLDPQHPSIKATVVYMPNMLKDMMERKDNINDNINDNDEEDRIIRKSQQIINKNMKIEVIMDDTISACLYLIHKYNIPSHKIGTLNFASAKNPGGGFRNGSGGSQEESLCRSSGLYLCLNTKKTISTAYQLSKLNSNHGLYHNFVIYSPLVPVIKNKYGELLSNSNESFNINFITCPAPNAGCARKNNINENEIKNVLIERIDSILLIAKYHNIRYLILGSFGCGCFKNNVEIVSNIFQQRLNHSKFIHSFDHVIFPVLEKKDFNVFRKAFGINI